MIIPLPLDKLLAWEGDLISLLLAEGRSTMGDLESLVGRLNHAALIIPLSRHFLNRIRRKAESGRHKKHRLQLDPEEIADLRLW
jgi:hypothetical protein